MGSFWVIFTGLDIRPLGSNPGSMTYLLSNHGQNYLISNSLRFLTCKLEILIVPGILGWIKWVICVKHSGPEEAITYRGRGHP